MTDERRLPVIVGAGQLRANRSGTIEDAREPLDLMLQAIRSAAHEARIDSETDAIDDITVVNIVSWAYEDASAAIAAALGARPRHTENPPPGGESPVQSVDRAAARIAAGESELALITGAEAVVSATAYAKAGTSPPWSADPGGPNLPDLAALFGKRMVDYDLVLPVRTYPLFENALRAELGQSFQEAQAWSASMYSEFSRVARENEAAWDPVVRSPEEIAAVTPSNRMVCFPYPKLMTARPSVDQAAAVLVTSLERARALGVADPIHVWGGAGGADSTDLLERVAYSCSPALEGVLTQTLSQAGVAPSDLAVIDLYSCFPVVPKFAGRVLGLGRESELTATGGLTAFGGPGSNYSLHSIVAVVQRLRRHGGIGLVYGNGGMLTKHHALLLADEAHEHGFVGREHPVRTGCNGAPPTTDRAEGRGMIETFTVEFSASGEPDAAYVIARDESGRRFLALAQESHTLSALTDPGWEPIGAAIQAQVGDDGRNHVEVTR